MNIIAAIILATLLADTVLNAIADILNLKRLQKAVPQSFQGYYQEERYRRSQEYLKVNTRFGWVQGMVELAALLAFWFLGGFAWLDHWARSWGYGPIPTGLIFIGTLAIAKGLLALPFDIYHTFGIEARFGFNQTTWPTFVTDRLKGIALSVIVGLPLLAGVLAFFQYAGPPGWLYCWIAVTGFMLAMQYIAPAWILPLFNKFSPLEEGTLKTAIFDYARSVDFPLTQVFVMDGSKRSSKSNAFFTGFGKNKRIALFDTLIAAHTVPELVAVLAHEIGHYQKKHIQASMVLSILHTGILLYLLSLFLSYPPLFEAFYVQTPSVYAGLVFFGILLAPLDRFLNLLLGAWSRKNEYQADRFAVVTTRDPFALKTALKKLSAHNLSNLRPHPFYVALNYSHPPVLKRLEAIASVPLARSRRKYPES